MFALQCFQLSSSVIRDTTPKSTILREDQRVAVSETYAPRVPHPTSNNPTAIASSQTPFPAHFAVVRWPLSPQLSSQSLSLSSQQSLSIFRRTPVDECGALP